MPSNGRKLGIQYRPHGDVMRPIETGLLVESPSFQIRRNLPTVLLHLEADARALHEPQPLRPIQEDELH